MKEINKEEFIRICECSQSMSEAAVKIGLHFNTFIRYAKKFNCYKPNQCGRGIHKKNNGNKIELSEILNGNHPEYQTSKLKIRLI